MFTVSKELVVDYAAVVAQRVDGEGVITVRELIQLYLDYGESCGWKKPTFDALRASFKHFVTFIGSESGLENRAANQVLTTKLIDGFRLYLTRWKGEGERKLSPVSVNSYLRAVRSLLNWSTSREYLARRPVVDLVKVDWEGPKETFTDQEFKQVLDATQKESSLLLQLRARAIVLLLHDTGLRAGELCRAKMRDISHQTHKGKAAHILHVPKPGKRGKPRDVPFSNATWEAIQAYRSDLAQPHGRSYKQRGTNPSWIFTSSKKLDEPMTVYGLRRMCERLEEHANIHNNPHSYRRFFASAWMNNSKGRAIETLAEVGGWSDINTIKKHYGRYRQPTLIEDAWQYSPFANEA